MVAGMIGTWDGTEFDDWYRRFVGVCKAFSLTSLERYNALLAGLGFERAGDILAMASAANRIKVTDGSEDSWLVEYLKEKFSSQQTAHKRMKALCGRRLQRGENIASYWEDKARLYSEFVTEMKEEVTGSTEDALFLDTVIDGLPQHLQEGAKQKFSSRSDLKAHALRSFLKQAEKPLQQQREAKSPSRPKTPVKSEKLKTPKKETPEKFVGKELSKPGTIRCFYCKQEGHKISECPKKLGYEEERERTQSTHGMKLRGKEKEKSITVVTDEVMLPVTVGRAPKLKFVELRFNKQPLRCMIDTGASYSILDRTTARKFQRTARSPTVKSLKTPTGILPIVAEMDLQTEFDNEVARFLVVDNFLFDALIGEDFLNKFGVDILHSSNEIQVAGKSFKMLDREGHVIATAVEEVNINPKLAEIDRDKLRNLVNDNSDIFEEIKNFQEVEKVTKHHIELTSSIPVVGNGILMPDPAKVEKVRKLSPPRNKKELRSFLGSTGYFRRFIPKYSIIARPLEELLRESAVFDWTEECSKAFDNLKECLTKHPIVQLPDMEKPFIVRTDASGFAIGGMLAQKYGGKIHPVAYWSRKLTTPEKNYSTTEREGLAVIEAIRHWKYFLESNKFSVETDHQALKSLLSSKNPSARLARWIAELQHYDLEIHHRPGKDMGIPDSLSRDQNLMIILKEGERLVDLQRQDPELIPMFDYLEKSVLPEDSTASKELVALAFQLAIEDEVLIHVRVPHGTSKARHLQKRLVIPQCLRTRILEECHDAPTAGHLGFDRTYARVQERYWWPNCWKQIKDYVEKCEKCALAKHGGRNASGEIIPVVVGSPWEQVGVDFLGPLPRTRSGYQYILTFCDYFTRWAIAIPTQGATSEETCDALIHHVYSKFGAPKKLISDNGPAFAANLTKKICERLGMEKIFITPYHPQANGLVERWNSTILGMLRTLVDNYSGDWEDHLDMVTFAYNTAVHPTIGYSPYFMNFGKEPLIPMDAILEKPVEALDVEKFVKQRLENLADAIKVAKETQEKAKRKAQGDFTPQEQADVKVGDQVLVDKPNAGKLEERWEGPFDVVKVEGSTVTVRYYGSPKKFHVSRTKVSKMKPKSLHKAPVEEDEQDPDLQMDPKDLIGKRVLVWWPTLKNWYKGQVVAIKGKRHLVRYDERSSNTPDGEDESYWEYLLGSSRRAKWKLLVPRPTSN